MKVVLDTNGLFAALASHGACAELVEHCFRFHEIISSVFIINELKEHLVKKLKLSPKKASEVAELLSSRMQMVVPSALAKRVCRDPDDDVVLGTALTAKCRCVITGDQDLLVLKRYKGIDILRPAEFWKYES